MKISLSTFIIGLTILGTAPFFISAVYKKSIDTPKVSYDTSKCIMLVVDTTDYPKGTHFDYETSIQSMGFAFILKGYQVSKKELDPFINKLMVVSYLYQDKKPLSKKYIVWNSKFDY